VSIGEGVIGRQRRLVRGYSVVWVWYIEFTDSVNKSVASKSVV